MAMRSNALSQRLVFVTAGVGGPTPSQWPTFQILKSMKVCCCNAFCTGVSDLVIAYQDVRDDKSQTKWLLLDYEVPNSYERLLNHDKPFLSVGPF